MNKESKKLSWAIGLVAGLGVLSIAYAALSSTLNVTGSGETNEGHVFFVEYSASPNEPYQSNTLGQYCTSHAIGSYAYTASTGDNYYTGYDPASYIRTSTAGVGSDASEFSSNVAKSLGNVGSIAISSSANTSGTGDKDHRRNDTITVSGTELYDYGSYVVYKLVLKNTAPNDMVLKAAPSVTISGPSSGTNVSSNIEASVTDSFSVSGGSAGSAFAYDFGNPVTAFTNTGSNASAIATNTVNALQKEGGTTTWYLVVKHKDVGAVEDSAGVGRIKNGGYSFTIKPVWEAFNMRENA